MKTKIGAKVLCMAESKFGKVIVKGRAIAPDVAIVGGLALVIGGTALAVKRSYDSRPKIDEFSRRADKIKSNDYNSEKKRRQDLTKVRRDFAIELTKTYGLPLAMTVVGTSGVLYGRHLFKLRNAALISSNAVLENRLSKLAKRVDETLGEGTAKRFQNGAYEDTVEVDYIDNNGKKKKKKEKRWTVDYDPNSINPNAVFFDASSKKWSKSGTFNLMAVRSIQDEYTKTLNMRKTYVTWLEVLIDGFKFVDLPQEKRDQFAHMIWEYDPNGDNVIDFGVFNNVGGAKINFVNGYENVLLLDPNLTGDLYSYLEKQKGVFKK